MNLSDKISEAELAIMHILWREAKPVTFSAIRTELHEKMRWEKSTIATLLRRLQNKGVISVQEKQIHYYTANITKDAYIKEKEKSMIDKLYEGSAKKLVASLCHQGALTEADIDELKLYFQMGDTKK